MDYTLSDVVAVLIIAACAFCFAIGFLSGLKLARLL